MFKLTEEEKVHLYVINKSLLQGNEITEIENKINSDISFKDFVENVKKVIEDIKTFDSADIDVGKITSRILNKNKIQYLFELKSLFPDDEDTDNLKLAAMQKKDANDNFVYFNTFASADNFILIRALKNSTRNEYKLFLICDDMTLVGNSVLKISNTNIEFIADNKGVVTLTSDYLNKNIDIKVFIPHDIFIINLNDAYFPESQNIKSAISIYKGGKFLDIEFENGYLSDKTLYGVFDGDLHGFVKHERITENKVRFEIPDDKVKELKLIVIKE